MGDARHRVLLGSGAAFLLLLIAAANVGNMFLVRGATRVREIAIRRALGAGRVRVIRGLILDGALIGILAACAGAALAHVILQVVLTLGPEQMPRRAELRVDAYVLMVIFAVSVTFAMIASIMQLIPARVRTGVLTARDATASRAGHALQQGFVVAQVALTLVLVIAAGLLTNTLTRLLNVPVGFHGERVLTAWVSLPRSSYDSAERIGVFYDDLFARVAALPGVEAVSGTWALPFSEDYASGGFVAADRPERERITVASSPVRGPYFETLGMRILEGRGFRPQDNADAPDVAVINETLARLLWPEGGAVGRYLADPDDPADRLQVVGVVNDVRRRTLLEPAEPELYQPHAQAGWAGGSLYLTVRTAGASAALVPALHAQVRELDPNLPLTRVTTLQERVVSSVTMQRFRASVVNAIGLTALVLTLLGLAAVQAVYVASHRRELALRLALGAAPGRLARELTGRGVRMAALGIVIGVTGALLTLRTLRSILFELSPLDPRTYAVVAFAFLGVAALASWLPVRRAARVDPALMLRHE